MAREAGLEKVEVVMAGVAMVMVVVAEVPALDLEARREGDQRLIGMRTPFEGKTQTGGERTRFLPRASTNFYKHFLKNHFSKIKHLYHPTLVGWSFSKDNFSECPR